MAVTAAEVDLVLIDGAGADDAVGHVDAPKRFAGPGVEAEHGPGRLVVVEGDVAVADATVDAVAH